MSSQEIADLNNHLHQSLEKMTKKYELMESSLRRAKHKNNDLKSIIQDLETRIRALIKEREKQQTKGLHEAQNEKVSKELKKAKTELIELDEKRIQSDFDAAEYLRVLAKQKKALNEALEKKSTLEFQINEFEIFRLALADNNLRLIDNNLRLIQNNEALRSKLTRAKEDKLRLNRMISSINIAKELRTEYLSVNCSDTLPFNVPKSVLEDPDESLYLFQQVIKDKFNYHLNATILPIVAISQMQMTHIVDAILYKEIVPSLTAQSSIIPILHYYRMDSLLAKMCFTFTSYDDKKFHLPSLELIEEMNDEKSEFHHLSRSILNGTLFIKGDLFQELLHYKINDHYIPDTKLMKHVLPYAKFYNLRNFLRSFTSKQFFG